MPWSLRFRASFSISCKFARPTEMANLRSYLTPAKKSRFDPCNRKQAVVPKGRYNRKNCTKSNSWPYNRKSFMKSKKISPRTALQSKIGPTIEKVPVEVPTLPTIEKIARNRTGGLQSKSGPIIELDASYNRNPSPIIEK